MASEKAGGPAPRPAVTQRLAAAPLSAVTWEWHTAGSNGGVVVPSPQLPPGQVGSRWHFAVCPEAGQDGAVLLAEQKAA